MPGLSRRRRVGTPEPVPADHPNVLYLHSHDTGRFVQPYGHAIRTPHIQRFAEQGVLFRHAFCANPTCSPSRASLLTGSYAHCNGMLGLAHRGAALNDYRQHLCHTLKAAGYTTALAGIQHVAAKQGGASPKDSGYDEVLGVPKTGDGLPDPSAAAIAYLNQRAEDGDAAGPLFLACGYGETHRAGEHFHPPPPGEPKTDPRYVKPPAGLPDTPATRQDMADFIDDARRLDWHIGRVLHALDRGGLGGSTLVIVTTDHGIAFPHHKCNLTDGGLGVMLMMRGPGDLLAGGFTGGKTVESMVSQVDLFPTLCDTLGIETPAWVQGRSLVPVLTGGADPTAADAVRDAVFAEVNYHAAPEPKRCVRTARYKYIRRYEDAWPGQRAPDRRGTPVLPNVDDSPSKTLLVEAGWAERPLDEERLHDLWFDPTETHNLAGSADHADVLADLRDRLERWMKETDDPLLTGGLPMPDHFAWNHPDGMSPGGAPRRGPAAM